MSLDVNKFLFMAKGFLPEKYKNKVDNSINTVKDIFINNNNNMSGILNEAKKNGFSADFITKLKPYTSNPIMKGLLKSFELEGNQVNNSLDIISSNVNNQNSSKVENKQTTSDISKLTNALNKIKKNY